MARRPHKVTRCIDCLYEIDYRATRCIRCYREHLKRPAYNAAESARKKRRKHYHAVIVNDPAKLEAHRAQSREGMKRLRDRRKQAQAPEEETDMSEITRYRCTAAAPWTPDKGQFAEHEDVEVRDKACGCCARHTCRVCGHTWTVEVPD